MSPERLSPEMSNKNHSSFQSTKCEDTQQIQFNILFGLSFYKVKCNQVVLFNKIFYQYMLEWLSLQVVILVFSVQFGFSEKFSRLPRKEPSILRSRSSIPYTWNYVSKVYLTLSEQKYWCSSKSF